MSRARYYFELPTNRSLPDGPLARWIFGVLGSMMTGAAVYVLLDGGFSLERGGAGIPAAFQLLLWGPMFLAHATGVTRRHLTYFVDITLGVVRWRLPAADGSELWPQYRRVSLARVRDIRVKVLQIDFVTEDGEVVSMPLGALPYQVVKEVKSRFEGEASLAGATGSQLLSGQVIR